MFPPQVVYFSEAEYRNHFERVYCSSPIITFDGISVRFRKRDFDHAFFESVMSKDDTFSNQRAQRIDWIKFALQDGSSERYVGWDNRKKNYDHLRRVTIVNGDYVVVIALKSLIEAIFITAYVADTLGRNGRLSTIDLIRQGPKWV